MYAGDLIHLVWLKIRSRYRIDLFGGRGANKRCADSCTGSDGATDDEDPVIKHNPKTQ